MADSKYYINCQYRLRTNATPRSDVIASVDESTGKISLYGANKLRSSSHVSRSIDKTLVLGEQVSQSTFNDYLYAIEKEDIAEGYYIECMYKNTYKKNAPSEICAIHLDDKGNITIYGADSLVIHTTLYRSLDKTVTFGKQVADSKFKIFLIAILSNEQRRARVKDAQHEIMHLENVMKINSPQSDLYNNAEVIALADRCELSLFTHDFAVELLSRTNTVKGLKSALRCIAIVVPYLLKINIPVKQSNQIAKNYDVSCNSLVTVELAKIAFSIAVNYINSRHAKPILPLVSKKLIFGKDKLFVIGQGFKKNPFAIPSTSHATMPNLISFFLIVIDHHLDDLVDFKRTALQLEDFEVLNKLKEDELHLRSYNVLQRLNTLSHNDKGDRQSIFAASILDDVIANISVKVHALNVAWANNESWDIKPLSSDIDMIEDFCNAYDFSPRADLLSNSVKIGWN